MTIVAMATKLQPNYKKKSERFRIIAAIATETAKFCLEFMACKTQIKNI